MSPSLLAGLVLALGSTIALDLAFLLQQSAAAKAPTLSLRAPVRAARALLGARRWVVGFVLGLGGWAVYFAALTLAPISLVQTVAAGGIGLLVVLQSLLTRRVPFGRERTGALVATAGLAALALSLGGATGPGRGTNLAVFAILGLALVPVVLATCWRSAGAAGLAAGLCYGLGDVATKTLLAQLPVHPTVGAVLLAPFLYLTAGAHAAGFLLLQRAFQRGPAVASIGAMTAATNLLPIAAGVLLLGDPLPSGSLAVSLRAGAFACAMAGAFLLATTRAGRDAPLAVEQGRQWSLVTISSAEP
jgi:hypothetical protein